MKERDSDENVRVRRKPTVRRTVHSSRVLREMQRVFFASFLIFSLFSLIFLLCSFSRETNFFLLSVLSSTTKTRRREKGHFHWILTQHNTHRHRYKCSILFLHVVSFRWLSSFLFLLFCPSLSSSSYSSSVLFSLRYYTLSVSQNSRQRWQKEMSRESLSTIEEKTKQELRTQRIA